MRFVFIDDDPDSRQLWLEWAEDKGHRAWAVESAFEAKDLVADYYVFDLSAVGDILQPHMMYSPICSLLELHPGATIITVSAMSQLTVEDVIADVQKHFPDADVRYGGWGKYKDFEAAL